MFILRLIAFFTVASAIWLAMMAAYMNMPRRRGALRTDASPGPTDPPETTPDPDRP